MESTQSVRRIRPMDQMIVDAKGIPVGLRDPTGQADFLPELLRHRIHMGRTFYVDFRSAAAGGKGANTNDGLSKDAPFLTMAKVMTAGVLRDFDMITWIGDCTETGLVTPAGIDFVLMLGSIHHPRASRWVPTAATATPALQVRGMGWGFANLYGAPGTADYLLSFLRDATYNASEGWVVDSVFNGGGGAIENDGGCSNMRYLGNKFINIRGGSTVAPGAIVLTSAAQAFPSNCEVIGNRFYNCQRHIHHGMMRSKVIGNHCHAVGHDGTATDVINLHAIGASSTAGSGDGDYNHCAHNTLGHTGANVTPGNGYRIGTNSAWIDNYALDAVDYGVPT